MNSEALHATIRSFLPFFRGLDKVEAFSLLLHSSGPLSKNLHLSLEGLLVRVLVVRVLLVRVLLVEVLLKKFQQSSTRSSRLQPRTAIESSIGRHWTPMIGGLCGNGFIEISWIHRCDLHVHSYHELLYESLLP